MNRPKTPAETINGFYKTEAIHRRSFETVEFATLEGVDELNNRRLQPIANIPPAKAEARCYAHIEQRLRASSLNQTASGKPGAVHIDGFWSNNAIVMSSAFAGSA